MTLRKPLVIGSSGEPQELEFGDTCDLRNYTAGLAPGDVPEVFSSTLITYAPRNRQVASNVTAQIVSGTTLGNVAGLAVTLPRPGTYLIEVVLLVSQTSAAGIFGCGLAIVGGGAPQITLAGLIWNAPTTTPAQRAQTSFPPAPMVGAAAAASGVTFSVQLRGTVFLTTAPATLNLQAQRSAGVTTVLPGGFVQAWQSS